MKRWIFTILLFLLLGAIVNIAVAWVFALGLDLGEGLRAYVRSRECRIGDTQYWRTTVYRRRGGIQIDSYVAVMPTGDDRPRNYRGRSPEELLPRWSELDRPELHELGPDRMFEVGDYKFGAEEYERAYGWPWPSLRFNWALVSVPERGVGIYEVSGGIVICEPRSKIDPEAIALPLIPIAPAFMGNTVLYAVVLGCVSLLWRASPLSLRRRRRMAAGRCPSCGYILGERLGEGCPECGWKRRSVPTPPRRWWTSVRTILLYLSLGFALSIAIAWVCVWSLDQERYWGRDDLEITSRDEAIAWWRDHAPAGFSRDPQQMHISRGGFGVSIASGMVFRPGNTGWKPDEHMIRIHAGWPLRALEGCVWDRNPRITSYTGIIRVPGPSVREGWLPIRPLWRGMVINAVFYAVLLRIAMHWTLALRRAVWLRTHRCPACGRPMGDSPICEKCGLRLPERRRSG